ncbi:MAG: glycosyltransferase family 39 protein [Planctomycetota bacterium]|nr:glycosyltransferase family 39 protein [Planctomycetota bacterium]
MKIPRFGIVTHFSHSQTELKTLSPDIPASDFERRVQCFALLAIVVYVLVYELSRCSVIFDSGLGVGGLLIAWDVRSTPFLILLALLPIACGRTKPRRWMAEFVDTQLIRGADESPSRKQVLDIALSLAIAGTSLVTSWSISERSIGERGLQRFGDLPPAYHDEYSYLFQAKTFLTGRLANPSHPTVPEYFDQMHVLNDDGVFASRYFPGTGAWMAPFVAIGHPRWGHWLAGLLTAVITFWIGRELDGRLSGVIAGFGVAVSPGIAIFSNLLLAHHPTMFGLAVFQLAFLRFMRTRNMRAGLIAGCGLSFAMLCRPMTAAGVGLPFGLWIMWTTFRSREPIRGRVGCLAALGLPLLVGFMVLAAYNNATTHNALQTPYQKYTDIYTPKHVYGFNNVIRGQQRIGQKVITDYDDWAENLTPELAAKNVKTRLLASWNWILAAVPLLGAVIGLVGLHRPLSVSWRLVIAAIVCLHLAHLPYWYDGIMHWHYVFESAPLWLLVFAGGSVRFIRVWLRESRLRLPVWWIGIVAVALIPQYVHVDGFWQSRVHAEVQSTAFAGRKHDTFRKTVAAEIRQLPAIVLVKRNHSDLHIDYVINEPTLDAEILFGRYRDDCESEVARHFPARTIYVYDAKTHRCRIVVASQRKEGP